jgi:hypothetical protein
MRSQAPDASLTVVPEGTGLAFMNANGLLHFDAHLGNILTDGQHLFGRAGPRPTPRRTSAAPWLPSLICRASQRRRTRPSG